MLSFYAEDATPTFELVALNRRLVCVRLGACVQKQHMLHVRHVSMDMKWWNHSPMDDTVVILQSRKDE